MLGSRRRRRGRESHRRAVQPHAARGAAISNAYDVSVGFYNVCAVISDTTARCFGPAVGGAVGDGTLDVRTTPVMAETGPGLADISWGCVVRSGGLWCVGGNRIGQLGAGFKSDVTRGFSEVDYVPVVGASSGVASVDTEGASACLVTTAGALKCWGANGYGQLGDGTTTDRTSPVAVSGLSSGVKSVSVGDSFACAVLTSGQARCWGYGLNGQLGNGAKVNSSTPTAVGSKAGPLTNVASIEAGYLSACAAMTDGTARCWGSDTSGMLGNGTSGASASPVKVGASSSSPLTGVKSVSVRFYTACALRTGGDVWCWGSNVYGQVGDGSVVDRQSPVAVSGLTGATDLEVSDLSACATVGGEVRCWGHGEMGGLGDGTTASRTVPGPKVTGLSGVVQLDAEVSTCARTSADRLYCWGYTWSGQMGNGDSDWYGAGRVVAT